MDLVSLHLTHILVFGASTLVSLQFLQASDPDVRGDLVEVNPLGLCLDPPDQGCVHPDIEALLGHTGSYTKSV